MWNPMASVVLLVIAVSVFHTATSKGDRGEGVLLGFRGVEEANWLTGGGSLEGRADEGGDGLLGGGGETRRPVVIVHGLRDGPGNYATLAARVRQCLPGVPVVILRAFSDDASMVALWRQVGAFWREMERVNASGDGITIICASQGVMVCRALLSVVHNHRVHTFISLGGPLMGLYGGEPPWVRRVFPWFLSLVSSLCYWSLGQEVSICNYWHDPTRESRYLQKNVFLPIINNETPHPLAHVFKRNFLELKRLVLVGGPSDGELKPWQTSFFGFYDDKASKVIDMTGQSVYRADLFGLRSLDRRGGLVTCSVPGVAHKAWVRSHTAFTRCVQPYLT